MNKWFEERNLRQLNYQREALEKVESSLREKEITVLASSPSSGKTIMSIYTIDQYLDSNPGHKVLVLTHGTTVLRTQFYNDIEETKPNFTSNLVLSYEDYDEGSSVNVCLPQTLYNNDILEFDLLVVDEAHQYYSKNMVQSIIRKGKPTKQLLLTGTPSRFVKRGFDIIPISLNDIMEEGMVSDLYVQIASSSYSFDAVNDYNQNGDLESRVYIKKSETNKTLDTLIGNIVEKLNLINNGEYEEQWVATLNTLHKTMFACKTQDQARFVKDYFNRLGINCALSVSDTDKDSDEIARFRKESDCLALIVVGRGILGFNYPDLVNIVDMTASQNVDKIYQLMARVIRKHPNGNKKLFFKLSPNGYSDYYKHIMMAVLSLADKKFFTKFNGKNFLEMKIPVIKTGKQIKVGKQIKHTTEDRRKKKAATIKPIEFEGLPAFQFFKDNIINDHVLDVYTFTTLKEVRSELLGIRKLTFWTYEMCQKSAMKYKYRTQWMEDDRRSYDVARRNGWLDNLTKHMVNGNLIWTYDKCLESALKFETKMEWMKENVSAYGSALKHGWIEELTKHMVNGKIRWTYHKCKKSALKYKQKSKWKRVDRGPYEAARTNGWLEELTQHM